MKITTAYTREDFELMEAVGRQIVPAFYDEYFPPEVGAHLLRGHTIEAFEAQVGEGYRHYMIEVEGVLVGYFALHEEDHTMVLTQFYLLKEARGRGIGQKVMEFIDRQAEELRVDGIELLVFRKNAGAVGLYRKNGFLVAEELLTPMGFGQTIEDYLMRKSFDRQ
jgi:diamine N-acetyltransferase